MTISLPERCEGALLGLATGDAMGVSVEFRSPGTFPPVREMTGGGPFDLEPGEWTDDTSLALCLAESLVRCRGFNPVDQLRRYCDWFRSGHLSSTGRCFDIGTTTREAITRFEETGLSSGLTSPYSASNGSLMRLVPVPLAYAMTPALAIEQSGESSATTHALPLCIDACRYLGALIIGAVHGHSKDELLSPLFSPAGYDWQPHPLTREIEMVACGSFWDKEPPEIQGRGYMAASLEAALWAFSRTDTFWDGWCACRQ